jgi:hypothetical protein
MELSTGAFPFPAADTGSFFDLLDRIVERPAPGFAPEDPGACGSGGVAVGVGALERGDQGGSNGGRYMVWLWLWRL